MKKLILCLTVSALALVSSQAADDKTPAPKPEAGTDKTPAATAPAASTTTASSSTDCCSDSVCKAPKPVAMSPRAAQLAGK